VRVTGLLLAIVAIAAAQNPPDWRKVGGASVNLALASPATGRVEQVWFSLGGSTLFARTQSGKVFVTADFVAWSPASDPVDAPALMPATAVRLPENGAAIVMVNDPTSIFALGRQVSRSQDGGRTWVNLTGYHGRAVIGPTQHSVAVSPVDPDQLVVANDYGVWRSLDGGATWAGLNQNLPNLSVERIVSTPTGVAGTRIHAAGLGELELPPGSAVWQVAMANAWQQMPPIRITIRECWGRKSSPWQVRKARSTPVPPMAESLFRRMASLASHIRPRARWRASSPIPRNQT